MTHVFTIVSYQVESIFICCYILMIWSLLSRIDQRSIGWRNNCHSSLRWKSRRSKESTWNRNWERDGKVRLTQKGSLQKVFQNFNINSDMKSVSTPLALHFKLRATMSPSTVKKREYISHVLYASAVDSLMYVMVCTDRQKANTKIGKRVWVDVTAFAILPY